MAVTEVKMTKKEICLRGVVLALGFWVTAMGSSFFIGSNLGADGYALMCQGIAKHIGFSVGVSCTLLSLFLMIVVFCVDRSYVKIGTVISLVVLGPSIDFWSWLCRPIHQFLNGGFELQLICVIIAILVVSLGISIVMSAHLGTHINDAVPVLLSKTVGKRFQFRVSKIAWDSCHVIIGVLLSGVFGVGTIMAAFCIGPVLQALIPISERVTQKFIVK